MMQGFCQAGIRPLRAFSGSCGAAAADGSAPLRAPGYQQCHLGVCHPASPPWKHPHGRVRPDCCPQHAPLQAPGDCQHPVVSLSLSLSLSLSFSLSVCAHLYRCHPALPPNPTIAPPRRDLFEDWVQRSYPALTGFASAALVSKYVSGHRPCCCPHKQPREWSS